MTLQERLKREGRQELAKLMQFGGDPHSSTMLLTTNVIDTVDQIILHTIEQTIKEVLEVVQTHEEGDVSRSECDADGLYCRSGCVHDAVKRIQTL